MTRSFASLCTPLALLALMVACTRHPSGPQLLVEIPVGFTGNFVLDMGVRDAAPLQKTGDVYRVTVPGTGKVQTSTLLEKPTVTFHNSSNGQIWGYSQSRFSTGDGIPIGGKIEFFVGTQKDFEAEQKKKNKSGRFPKEESFINGA